MPWLRSEVRYAIALALVRAMRDVRAGDQAYRGHGAADAAAEGGAAMTTNTMLSTVPVADTAMLPEKYVAATKALSECTVIDECKDWADKAAALASYAKQAEDDTLLKMAKRIQARAVRRAGELLKEIPPAKN